MIVPMQHQVEALEWMRDRGNRVLNADEPGCGKTLVSLLAHDREAMGVVCPASIKYNWANEVRKCRPDLTPVVCGKRKQWRLPRAGEVFISNYEQLPDVPPDRPDYRMTFAVDEAHALKSRISLRSERFHDFVEDTLHEDDLLIGMTGTPVINNAGETHDMLANMDMVRDSFGSYAGYLSAMAASVGDNGQIDWGDPTSTFHRKLAKVMIRRTKKQVLPWLPDKRWRVIEVDAGGRELRRLMDDGLERLEALVAMAEANGKDIGKLPGIGELSRVRRLMADQKQKAVMDVASDLQAQGEPRVVACAHRNPIEAFGALPGYTTIHGGVGKKSRVKRQDAFQAGEFDGISLTIGAGCVGLNLFRASQMLFVDLAWTEAMNDQMEGRIHRNGQKNACLYTIFVLDHPLDRRMGQILHRKSKLFGSMVKETRAA